MHGLKQLVYDNQPFFSLNQTGKTNRELYILWKQNKRDDIFLLLYTQLWMALEEVYMENVSENGNLLSVQSSRVAFVFDKSDRKSVV